MSLFKLIWLSLCLPVLPYNVTVEEIGLLAHGISTQICWLCMCLWLAGSPPADGQLGLESFSGPGLVFGLGHTTWRVDVVIFYQEEPGGEWCLFRLGRHGCSVSLYFRSPRITEWYFQSVTESSTISWNTFIQRWPLINYLAIWAPVHTKKKGQIRDSFPYLLVFFSIMSWLILQG
jgi:hypothetical protein